MGLFSIKCQEVTDAHTGVTLCFGANGRRLADARSDHANGTVWVRVAGGERVTTIVFHRDGDVLTMTKGMPPDSEDG